MQHNCFRRHCRQTTLSLTCLSLATVAALVGCNSVTQEDTINSETLGSTIIADDSAIIGGDTLLSGASTESAADYTIEAAEDDNQPGLWKFDVVSKRRQTSNNLRFEWDFGTGETFPGETHSRQFTDPGLYLVVVIAYDINDSQIFVLSLEIDIPAVGLPPTALAGPNQIVSGGEVVLLDGSNSGDPDNDPITFLWSQTGAGVAIQLNNENGAIASFTAPSVDEDITLQFALTVSDAHSAVQDVASITVLATTGGASVAYIADAGPDMTVIADATVTLDGSASNASNFASYQWSQLLGPTVTLSNPGSAIASFIAPSISGSTTILEFALFVEDGGLAAFDNVVITVLSQTPTDDTIPNGGTDACPNDPIKTAAGICGCGVADTDSDADGTPDCNDTCPNDSAKTQPGNCGCGSLDTDTDSDGTADCNDNCPSDPAKTSPGFCGCGLPDIDSNNDGVADTCSNTSNSTTLNPIADAQIRSGVFANTNYGSEAFMGIVGNGGDWNLEGYARFDLSTITGVATSAQFRIYVENTGNTPVEVRATADANDGWNESTITWNNSPVVNQLISTVSSSSTGWVTVDVTSLVQNEQQGNNILSLNFVHGGSSYMAFTTREGSNAPELVITRACNGTDSDGDGVEDCDDLCPSDPNKTVPGQCGCGVVNADADGDGVCDQVDACPGFDDNIDTNNNGVPDACESAKLCTSGSSLNLGSSSTQATINVWNCGGASLAYTVSDNQAWLSASPTSGDSTGEQDTITIFVDRTGLAANTYQGTVTVTPSTGTAIAIIVSMTVGVQGGTPPNAQFTQTRISGVSPLGVVFDASATSSVATSRPFHDLDYTWDFGDAGSSFVNRPSINANRGKGGIAAHVFELPAGVTSRNYTVVLTVLDETGARSTRQQVITVNSFSGTTYYVSSSSGNDANSGLTTGAPFKSWNKAVATLFSSNGSRRILFKRGETFTTNTIQNHGNRTGPYIIGAYGTGNKPIIRSTHSGVTLKMWSTTVDVRIMDIFFDGPYPGGTPGNALETGTNTLLLRTQLQGYSYGISNSGQQKNGNVYSDCIFNNHKSYGIFYKGASNAASGHVAVMACDFDMPSNGEHSLRSYFTNSLIWANIFRRNVTRGHQIKFVGLVAPLKVEYCIISDNIFLNGDYAWSLAIGPQNTSTQEVTENIIVERNIWDHTGRDNKVAIQSRGADDVTVRNNVFINSEIIVGLGSSTILYRWDGWQIYNNTIYKSTSTGSSKNLTVFRTDGNIGHLVTNVEIHNNVIHGPTLNGIVKGIDADNTLLSEMNVSHNIWHFPSKSNGSIFDVGGSSYTFSSWNSAGRNSLNADPLLDLSGLPANWSNTGVSLTGLIKLRPGSPAIDAGQDFAAVFEDFLTTQRHLGARTDMGAYEVD